MFICSDSILHSIPRDYEFVSFYGFYPDFCLIWMLFHRFGQQIFSAWFFFVWKIFQNVLSICVKHRLLSISNNSFHFLPVFFSTTQDRDHKMENIMKKSKGSEKFEWIKNMCLFVTNESINKIVRIISIFKNWCVCVCSCV